MIASGDLELFQLANRNVGRFDLATKYYLRGFVPLPYQYVYHQLTIPNVTLVAGIASGKTVIAAASNLIDCISIPYFQALNTSVTAKQAELAFDICMGWIEGNPEMERMITDIRLRPWPIIKFATYSQYEFRTSGQDARFIRGDEYDRITEDECGLDFSGQIAKVLRGRLRGVRPDGAPRMARFDCISSPTDAPWFRERYDRGDPENEDRNQEDEENYLSMRVRTRDNTHLTEPQIAAMEAEYTDEEKRVEMEAYFPDYGLAFFPKQHIQACTDQSLYDLAYMAINPESGKAQPGWNVEEHPRHGIVEWEMPYDPECTYVLAGDPGRDAPPKRNAGAVGVLNISKKPAQLAYLAWVDGKGSYRPFLDRFDKAMYKYNPIFKLLDTTGTQAGIQELAYEEQGVETDDFNFSVNRKSAALNFLNTDLTRHGVVYPPIKGLLRQLLSYSREEDKPNSGLPQDLVMMMGMLSYAKSRVPEGASAAKSSSRFGLFRRGRSGR